LFPSPDNVRGVSSTPTQLESREVQKWDDGKRPVTAGLASGRDEDLDEEEGGEEDDFWPPTDEGREPSSLGDQLHQLEVRPPVRYTSHLTATIISKWREVGTINPKRAEISVVHPPPLPWGSVDFNTVSAFGLYMGLSHHEAG